MSRSTFIYKYSRPQELLCGEYKGAEIVDVDGEFRASLDEDFISSSSSFKSAVEALSGHCDELPDNQRKWRRTELKGVMG